MKSKKNIFEKSNSSSLGADFEPTDYEEPGVLVLGEDNSGENESKGDAAKVRYMPRFTEASEKHRRKGDAKIRERLGLKSQPERTIEDNPDEISLDPTAEFDEDIAGSPDAKEPENVAVDESDESISVYKFANSEEELEAEAEKEREEIKKLLATDKPKVEPVAVPEIEEPVEDSVEEEPVEEAPVVEEKKEYSIPDPNKEDFEVYDFADKGNKENKTPTPTPTPARGERPALRASETARS